MMERLGERGRETAASSRLSSVTSPTSAAGTCLLDGALKRDILLAKSGIEIECLLVLNDEAHTCDIGLSGRPDLCSLRRDYSNHAS
jgi:hypothetical protein